jgi:hypothetical protein
MGKASLLALRVVLVIVLAGSLFVQLVMVPLMAIDLGEEGGELSDRRVPIVAIIFLGIVAGQVTLVCVWRLVTMVRAGRIFSGAAFRYVDVAIGALVAASLLTFGFAVTLAPGDEVPPGGVLLVGGLGVLIAGVALIGVVLRMLLVQAVARDAEAIHLQAELDEVI